MCEGESLPFDLLQERTIFYDLAPDGLKSVKKRLNEAIVAGESDSSGGNPLSGIADSLKFVGSDKPVEKLTSEIFTQVASISDKVEAIHAVLTELDVRETSRTSRSETDAHARYIDGETEAFAALTEVTRRARNTIMSTRFFPDSVLTQPDYVSAMEKRIMGTDGLPPLAHYFRIVAVNNPEKQKDIFHHLNMFAGRPFELYLTQNQNAFELVIVDETDAFIHFYKKERVIASTLHIQGKLVVREFIEIFQQLTATGRLAWFKCKDIDAENLSDKMAEARQCFENYSPLMHQKLHQAHSPGSLTPWSEHPLANSEIDHVESKPPKNTKRAPTSLARKPKHKNSNG